MALLVHPVCVSSCDFIPWLLFVLAHSVCLILARAPLVFLHLHVNLSCASCESILVHPSCSCVRDARVVAPACDFCCACWGVLKVRIAFYSSLCVCVCVYVSLHILLVCATPSRSRNPFICFIVARAPLVLLHAHVNFCCAHHLCAFWRLLCSLLVCGPLNLPSVRHLATIFSAILSVAQFKCRSCEFLVRTSKRRARFCASLLCPHTQLRVLLLILAIMHSARFRLVRTVHLSIFSLISLNFRSCSDTAAATPVQLASAGEIFAHGSFVH